MTAKPTRWSFGCFEIDAEASVLLKNGEPVRIGPQPFRALALLVSRAGEVVTREELQKEIWGERVHVDFERGLNVCIRQIRTAIDDHSEANRIIVTCPREGYRMGVAVKPSSAVRWRALQRSAAAAAILALIAAGYLSAPHGVSDRTVASTPSSYETYGGPSPLDPVPFSPAWLTRSIDAHSLYWRGRGYYDRSTGRKPFGALQYFERAATLDATFALAHVGVAVSYVDRAAAGIAPEQSESRARQAADRALTLDPRSAEAHVAVAELGYRLNNDNAKAEHEFIRAVQLDGGSAYVRQRYATFLKEQRRFDEALEQLRIAEELDPVSLVSSWLKADVLFYAHRYEDAIAQSYRTLDIDPSHSWSYRTIGRCLEALGREEEAVEAYRRAGSVALGHLGRAYALVGNRAAAHEILSILRGRPIEELGHNGLAMAYVYTGLGDSAAAMESLEQANQDGVRLPFSLRLAPQWEQLRASRQFTDFLNTGRVAGM